MTTLRITQVATFSHPEHFGGAERVITEISARLAARGHAVTLITSHGTDTAEREQRDGVTILRYPIDRGSTSRLYRSVFTGVRTALAAAPASDVAHLHQWASAMAVLTPGAALAGRALVSTFHAPYHREFLARWRHGHDAGAVPFSARARAALLRCGDRWILRRSVRVLVLSEFARGQVAELSPEAAERTAIAPAGVDLDRFTPATPDEAPAAFDLPAGNAPCLLSVRRLVPRMGLMDLLEAAAALNRDGIGCRVAIAGTGPEQAALAARASKPDLEGRVALLGRIPDRDLPALYRAADVFVLPTRALEGFGMSTAEALASGLPVVGTDAGATGEVLAGIHGSSVVPAGNVDALGAALGPLLADPATRREASRAARSHAERALNWDAHVDAVEQAARLAIAAGQAS